MKYLGRNGTSRRKKGNIKKEFRKYFGVIKVILRCTY